MEYYVDNAVFTRDLARLRDDPASAEAQTAVVSTLYKIARNLLRCHPDLADPEDAVQDGVLKAWGYLDRFDPARGKAFAFFTASIKFSYLAHRYQSRGRAIRFVPLFGD